MSDFQRPQQQQQQNGPRREKRKVFLKRKVCRFCPDQHIQLSYKDPTLLRGFTTERGKIIPRRISGNCASHQRDLTTEIKRSRALALLPFTAASTVVDGI